MKFLLKTKPLQSLFEFVPVIEQVLPEEGEGVKERTLFLAPRVVESESKLGRPPACIGGSQSALPAVFGLICNEKTYRGRTGKSLSNGRRRPGTATAWPALFRTSAASLPRWVAVKCNHGIHKGPQASGETRYFPVLCAPGKESSNSYQGFSYEMRKKAVFTSQDRESGTFQTSSNCEQKHSSLHSGDRHRYRRSSLMLPSGCNSAYLSYFLNEKSDQM